MKILEATFSPLNAFTFVSLQAYYYCAILEDVMLRFAWTIPLSLGVLTSDPFIGDILATILAPLEVFR